MAARGVFRIIIVFFLALLVPSGVVGAVEYGGLGGIPANPDPDNPRTKSIFVYALSPNASKQDGVNVINNTAETKTVEVYATDSEIASGGSFACKQKVDAKILVGSWINLSKTEVLLAPNSNQVIPFNVKVPGNVGVGEHNGCIVIQEKDGVPEQAGNGVQLSFRSAIRVAITIPGDIKKEVEFTGLSTKPEAKKYIITAVLNNKGNVSLDTDVKVVVKNLFNRNVYHNGGVYPLLAQNRPVELNYDFSRPFWGGFYRLLGSAEYNGDVNSSLGSTAPKNVRSNAPSKLLFILPHPSALLLLLLALILVWVLIWWVKRRRRDNKMLTETWVTHKIRKKDTLQSLAEERATTWKMIAKVNKLRAPYELKPGTTIKLPPKPQNK